MAGIGPAPCRAVAAEDIRDLQRWTRHASRASGRRFGLLELSRDAVERAHDLLDRLGGDARIERRGVELGMAEQDLDHPDIDVLLEQMGGKAVPQGVERYALAPPRYRVGSFARSSELPRERFRPYVPFL